MSLARDLGMTRRRLLNEMDSREFTLWDAYFAEINRPPEPKKENPEELANRFKTAFMVRNVKKRKDK